MADLPTDAELRDGLRSDIDRLRAQLAAANLTITTLHAALETLLIRYKDHARTLSPNLDFEKCYEVIAARAALAEQPSGWVAVSKSLLYRVQGICRDTLHGDASEVSCEIDKILGGCDG
jgi:hypothetical protein